MTSFLARLLGTQRDPRDRLRPLWHRIVAISREPRWYADDGVADSVAGRFDMITAITALVMLRMERAADLQGEQVMLTELFVEDMDGQLRESGVGDVVVGKHMGRLMSVLGGRLGAYREALDPDDRTRLEDVIERNVTLLDGAGPAPLASDLRAMAERLADLDDEAVRDGEIA